MVRMREDENIEENNITMCGKRLNKLTYADIHCIST
jgi:hypothetical protein